VLGLHRVLTEQEKVRSDSLDSIVVREETFEGMLRYLARQFKVVSLDSVLAAEDVDAIDPKPYCVLTFDDGWKDNYTTAYPWLKKFRLPATIFLVTGMVDGPSAFWVERVVAEWQEPRRREHIASGLGALMNQERKQVSLEAGVEFLKRMAANRRQEILSRLLDGDSPPGSDGNVDRMMSWDQIREMSRNGIDFGTHSVTHPLLPFEDDKTVEWELTESKATLEAKLKKQIRAFAYPNGDWDARVRRSVQQSGYRCAFTTRPGWYSEGDDPYTIRRVLIHEGNVTGWKGTFSPAAFSLTLARGG
jgi:peptidoglycan/xylan/chitin deacetylase (PgdA/CDA1 family)